jgi:hypothetical protein
VPKGIEMLPEEITCFNIGDKVKVETKDGWVAGTLDNIISGPSIIVVVNVGNFRVFCLSISCLKRCDDDDKAGEQI